MKKFFTGAFAALTLGAACLTAAPAQAAAPTQPVQHAVSASEGAHTQGIIYGFCYIYPNYCWDD